MDTSFDQQILQLHPHIKILAFDPTPKARQYVLGEMERGRLPKERYIYKPIGIADKDGQLRLRPPENPSHVSWAPATASDTDARSFEVKALESILMLPELRGEASIPFVKLDIENAEYDAMQAVFCHSSLLKQRGVPFERIMQVAFPSPDNQHLSLPQDLQSQSENPQNVQTVRSLPP